MSLHGLAHWCCIMCQALCVLHALSALVIEQPTADVACLQTIVHGEHTSAQCCGKIVCIQTVLVGKQDNVICWFLVRKGMSHFVKLAVLCH